MHCLESIKKYARIGTTNTSDAENVNKRCKDITSALNPK